MNRSAVPGVLVLLLSAALAFAAGLWNSVLHFDPAFVFEHERHSTGAPLTNHVTIVLIDGLRVDASRQMPTLNALRTRGVNLQGRAYSPSFSRVGRATIAVGAPPAIHGVTTNRQRRAVSLDNLIRRIGEMGGACRVAGSAIWNSLFGADITRCGAFQLGESKEGRGAFVRQIDAVRASQTAAADFVMAEPATLRIVDAVSPDFAAHEYGGTSREYADEVARVDAWLATIVARMDLSTETIVVTADHGHTDVGGHGGEEPAVLAIPVVMAGRGVKAAPGEVMPVSQADIAPTVAALLGANVPEPSSGWVLTDVLTADAQKRAALLTAQVSHTEAWLRVYSERLGVVLGADAAREGSAVRSAHLSAMTRRRLPWAVVAIVLLVLLPVAAARASGLGGGPLAVGCAVFAAIVIGPVRWWGPTLTFSSINYDEQLYSFFGVVIAIACVAALVSVLVAWLAVRRVPNDDPRTPQLASVSVALCAMLAMATVIAWCTSDLLSPVTLPGSDLMVEVFALALSAAGIAVLTLILWTLASLYLRFRTVVTSITPSS